MKTVTCMLASLLLLAGCENDKTVTVPSDTYRHPAVPQGQITVIGHNSRSIQFLGAGYDIMGDYMSSSSVKSPVVDLEKIPAEQITVMKYPSSYGKSYLGRNLREFLESIRDINGFTVTGERLLFTGTIFNSLRFTDPDDFSTRFSFAYAESVRSERIMRLNPVIFSNPERWASYLSDEFKTDLERLSADKIIEKYGTHLLIDIQLGSRLRTLYRSVVANNASGYTTSLLYGLTAREKQIFKRPNITTYEPAEEVARNHGGTIFVECFGGDPKRIPFLLLSPNEVLGEPMDLTEWSNSLDESNYVLTSLKADGLILLDEVIADPVKKQQVRDAIEAHITAQQLKIVETAPIYEAVNGNRHRYFRSFEEFEAALDPSLVCGAPIGALYVQQHYGTTPLYQYSDGENDRLSTEYAADGLGGMKLLRTMGYVYAEGNNDPGHKLIELHEISNGRNYAYTTEAKDAYGEHDSWKRVRTVCYISKLAYKWQ